MRFNIFFFSLLLIANWSVAQQNTIIIIADDVSPDYFGFYNNSDTAVTPVLSDLANKGIIFDHAWAYPICSPTRSSIMTGRYGFRTGMGHVVAGAGTNQLSNNETTLGEILRGQTTPQYGTGIVGKWHLHTQQGNLAKPQQMGFQYYSGNFAGGIPDYYSYNKIVNGSQNTNSNYSTTEIVNDAISWIDTLPSTQPFFLWVAFNAPHTPFHKPPSNLISQPNLPGTIAHINNNEDLYFKAAIDALDSETGRLLQYLSGKGKLDSTNIIFIGDNGSPRQVSKNPLNNRSKGTIYNYGVQVPMFICGPAVVSPNRRSNELVSTVDLFATIANLSNANTWNPNNIILDSKSLLPIIENQTSIHRDYQFSEQFGVTTDIKDGKSIRNHEYHLIRFDSTGNQEFYKISTDTFETIDLLLNQSSMTATDVINYHMLCDSLSALVGGMSCLPLSIQKQSQRIPFTIYPNPTYGTLFLSSSENIWSIQLTDATGRKILDIEKSNINKIDTRNITSGQYFIKVNKQWTQPFIKR